MPSRIQKQIEQACAWYCECFYPRKRGVMNESRNYGNYTITCLVGTMGEEDRAGVIDLWMRNQILPPGESAEQRVNQVVLTARETALGNVIGVNTVYMERSQADGPEYYMYRTFIQPDHRINGMSRFMLNFAYEVLNRRYRAGEPVGLAFLTDNLKLQRPGAMTLLKRDGWEYVGRGPLGRDLWRRMFSPVCP